MITIGQVTILVDNQQMADLGLKENDTLCEVDYQFPLVSFNGFWISPDKKYIYFYVSNLSFQTWNRPEFVEYFREVLDEKDKRIM